MSSNTVHARMVFSFRGETYELESRIDLDPCVGEAGEPPNFPLLLAKASGIDPYSYLYEVMESHEIEFSEATGVAARCCHDGGLDWARFVRDVCEESELRVVGLIAERTLGVSDLDGRADLKAALLAAYRAGKAAGPG